MELSRAGGSLPDLSKVSANLKGSMKGKKDENERSEEKRAAYVYLKEHFNVTKFILESGHKLRLPPIAIASACVIYHRFWRTCSQMGPGSVGKQNFDPYLIGATVLYLASKAEESPRKLRDVINVCHREPTASNMCLCRLLHKETFLEIGSEYWSLRDSVANCELFVLRVLGFKVATDNPHKAMCDTTNIDEVQGIIGDLMDLYDFESKPLGP
ncbi:hypothetical protein QZH41_013649 [Actinostola sp. cb2023]|nr:hypothetical protein QZH41_013649 [Actinostola sp. cb2023]